MMVPWLVRRLSLPFAAMPSLNAPVVVMVPWLPLVMVLPLPVPSSPAARLVPVPPPPVRVSVPLCVIWLPVSTLMGGHVDGYAGAANHRVHARRQRAGAGDGPAWR
ncbi:hypothetical protein [Cupriavidus sp. BIC8F]|uniref:hypothetical protein n=1 Tax=Cupriavidus sp. BIC8F TaxID=3079014 RepID=UPI002915E624|nr:hypothetical protein [Cupriavidus sp. BIC8F]